MGTLFSILIKENGRKVCVPGNCTVTNEYDAGPLLRAIADTLINFDLEDDFTARELCNHAKVVGGALQAAIGERSPHQLGKLFRDIVERERVYDGLSIICIGKQDNAALWRIKVECEPAL